MTDLRARLANAINKHALENHGILVPGELADVLMSTPGITISEGLTQEHANLCGNDEYAPLHVRWVTEWQRVSPTRDRSCPHKAAADVTE